MEMRKGAAKIVSLLMIVLSLCVTIGPAAPGTVAQAGGGGPSGAPDGGLEVLLAPRAGVAPAGSSLEAELRLEAEQDFAAFEISLSASTGVTIEGAATLSLPGLPSGAETGVPLRYRVAGPGEAAIEAWVTVLDPAGAPGLRRRAQLFLLSDGQEVLQTSTGPLDLRLLRLDRDRAAGRLDEAAYQEARDQALGGGAGETGSLTGQPPAVPPGFPPTVAAASDLTISGRILWTDSAGVTHPVRRAPVEIRDDETFGTDLVTTVTTNDSGDYLAVVNNDDGFLQGGRDIFIRVRARGTGFFITTNGGDEYRLDSSIVDDAADGSTLNFNLTANNTADNNTAFSIHSALVTANDYVTQVRGSGFADIQVRFPNGQAASFFRPSDVTLNLRLGDRFDWDVIHHEYGHYVQFRLNIANNPGGPHAIGANLSEALIDHDNNPATPPQPRGKDGGTRMAWGEGWPTYFGTGLQQILNTAAFNIPNVGDLSYTDTEDGNFGYSLESNTGFISAGEDNELAVQRILWDIYDSADDAGDGGVALGDTALWSIIDASDATTFSAGYQAIVAGRSLADTSAIGCILAQHAVAPAQSLPLDRAAARAAPPTFSWSAQGGGPAFRNNAFVVEFYDASLGALLFASPEQGATSFAPTPAQWSAIAAASGASLRWLVRARQTGAPVTGQYVGCSRELLKANLQLTKVCAPDGTVPLGQPWSCTITVSNLGPGAAPGTVVQDTLMTAVDPASFTIDPPASSLGGCAFTVPNQQFTCNLGTLAAGQSATITVDITSSAAGVFTNHATVSGDVLETSSADNQGSDTVEAIATSDLAVTKTAAPEPVAAGGLLTYQIEVSNAGPNDAAQVRVLDTLPPGVIYSGATIGCVEAPAGTVTCDISDLLSGESRAIGLGVLVPGNMPSGSSLTNKVSVSYLSGLDPNPANNAAEATSAVVNFRVTEALQALYTFEEGAGATIHDVSGVGAPLDLMIGAPAGAGWTPGGLAVTGPAQIGSAGTAGKVSEPARATSELTLEAWVRPAIESPAQEGSIVALATDAISRNVTLAQLPLGTPDSGRFNARIRTTASDPTDKGVVRPPITEAELAHVVFTFDSLGIARLYVDGVLETERAIPGNLTSWGDARLALASELDGTRLWQGEYKLLAFYSRAISPAEVRQNYLADPSGGSEAGSSGIQALYTFDEGAGALVHDTSGVGAPLDLTVADPAATSWTAGGLSVNGETKVASAGPADKLTQAAKASGELTIVAWVVPTAAEADTQSRIVSLANDANVRNVSLIQQRGSAYWQTRFNVRLRTTKTGAVGDPPVRTSNLTREAALTQVVYTRDSAGTARIYLDGALAIDGQRFGTLDNWDASYRLVLANELTGSKPWTGEYRRLELHNRALSPAEVAALYAAGSEAP